MASHKLPSRARIRPLRRPPVLDLIRGSFLDPHWLSTLALAGLFVVTLYYVALFLSLEYVFTKDRLLILRGVFRKQPWKGEFWGSKPPQICKDRRGDLILQSYTGRTLLLEGLDPTLCDVLQDCLKANTQKPTDCLPTP